MILPIKAFGYLSGAAALAGLIFLSPMVKADENVWPTLKQQTFGDRAIAAEDGMVVLEIPGTAEDAAIVPLTVRVPPTVTQELKSLTLFIDKNPDPRVATLTFGPAGERRRAKFLHPRAHRQFLLCARRARNGGRHAAYGEQVRSGCRRLRGDAGKGCRCRHCRARKDDR